MMNNKLKYFLSNILFFLLLYLPAYTFSVEFKEIEKSLKKRMSYSGFLISKDSDKSIAIIKENFRSVLSKHNVYKIGDTISGSYRGRNGSRLVVRSITPEYIDIEHSTLLYEEGSSSFISNIIVPLHYTGDISKKSIIQGSDEWLMAANNVSLESFLHVFTQGNTILSRHVFPSITNLSFDLKKATNTNQIYIESNNVLNMNNLYFVKVSEIFNILDTRISSKAKEIQNLRNKYCKYQKENRDIKIQMSRASLSYFIQSFSKSFTKPIALKTDKKHKLSILSHQYIEPCDLLVGIIYAYNFNDTDNDSNITLN